MLGQHGISQRNGCSGSGQIITGYVGSHAMHCAKPKYCEHQARDKANADNGKGDDQLLDKGQS